MKYGRLLLLGVLVSIAGGCWLDSPQEGAVYGTHNVHVSGFTSAPNETLQVWTLDGSGNWQPKGTVVTSGVPTYHCTNIPNVPYDEYRFDTVMNFVHGARTIRVTEEPTGNCVQSLDYACWNANPQLDPCARASKCLAKCAVHFTVSAR